MKILVTGAAGFIGFHLVKRLINEGHFVIGLDNVCDDGNIAIKKDRLKAAGISLTNCKYGQSTESSVLENYKFVKLDISDMDKLNTLFQDEKFDMVANLAALTGVRKSVANPRSYLEANINAFFNILECCKEHKIKNLVFASSSSVYGKSSNIPYSTLDKTDEPISFYAATKKCDELMAHSYSHIYGMNITGLRFFTVYGPWGRPDMALFKFTEAIFEGKPIKIYNFGDMQRDFTYIDDIVMGVYKVLMKPAGDYAQTNFKVYNIGNSSPVPLKTFVEAIEKHTGISAKKEYLPLQPGDMKTTWASVDDLINDFGYKPESSLDYGIKNFVEWFMKYKQI